MSRGKKKTILPIMVAVMAMLVAAGFVVLMYLYKPIDPKVINAVQSVYMPEPEIVFDKNDENLKLVNKDHSVDSDYRPDDLVRVNSVAPGRSGDITKLRPEAAEAFNELTAAAKADGYTIALTSGYRSYSHQSTLYNSYMKRNGAAWTEMYSAKPGTSEHHLGLAADVSTPGMKYALGVEFEGTAEAKWLAENAYKYGFILRYGKGKEDITGYAYEPWHIRYVGKGPAWVIYDEGITFEEFWDEYVR